MQRLFAALVLLLAPGPAVVSSPSPTGLDARLSIGAIQGDGWSASGVTLVLRFADTLGGVLRIEHLALPDREIQGLRIRCGRIELDAAVVRCQDGDTELPVEELDAAGAGIEVALGLDGTLRSLELTHLAIAGGHADVAYRPAAEPSLSLALDAVSIGSVLGLAGEHVPRAIGELARLTGSVSGRIELSTGAEGLPGSSGISGALSVRDVELSDEAGTLATAGLGMELSLALRREGDGWSGPVSLEADAGEFYAQPPGLSGSVYLALSERPLRLEGALGWRSGAIRLDDLALHHPGALQAEGRLLWDGGLAELALTDFEADLPAAYRTWLAPFHYGTALGSLETRGQVAGSIAIVDGRLDDLDLRLTAVDAEAEAWALRGLSGQVDWNADEPSAPTELAWATGRLSKVPIGGASVSLRLAGGAVGLLEPVRVPVLDGALEVDAFGLDLGGAGGTSGRLEAELEPLSLEALTAHLDLPRFGGTLSGSLPSLSYQDGVLSVAGELRIRAFDGDIRVDGLQAQDLFGVLPRIRADVAIEDLDLALLTRTFEFGSITGRLDGRVTGLRMLGLEPVAFDAEIHTPEDDDSRHRISQRAVQNISRIGGGSGAALSSGLISFFETFSYDRLGWRCRLEAEICHMGGVAPHPRGYYLVKGSGLPRIDVIGDQERVDWPVLLSRLERAVKGRGPRVD